MRTSSTSHGLMASAVVLRRRISPSFLLILNAGAHTTVAIDPRIDLVGGPRVMVPMARCVGVAMVASQGLLHLMYHVGHLV